MSDYETREADARYDRWLEDHPPCEHVLNPKSIRAADPLVVDNRAYLTRLGFNCLYCDAYAEIDAAELIHIAIQEGALAPW